MLVGWVFFILLHAINLFRFRRHIPAWVRSKTGREAERMQTQKAWSLPVGYLVWLVMLLDILVFGQIIHYAEFGVGNGLPSFGASMKA